MADDQDKSQQTEEPTQKRLDQAREQGDTVKSTEVTAFILLGGGTLAIAMFGQYTATGLAKALMIFLEQPDSMAVDGAGLAAISRGVLYQMAMTLAPFFGVMMLAAVAGHLVQGLPTFNLSKVAPDFAKVSPMAGFKRLFGLDGWVNLLKEQIQSANVDLVAELGTAPATVEQLLALKRHGASFVQGADGGAVGAGRDRGRRLFLPAHPLHAAQPHVQAGDQGRVSPE